MQHRYVPDLGDFSKFAVIDALSGQGRVRTALVWYLVDPHEIEEGHNNDGKHTAYLRDDRQGYASCHPELYRRFQAIDAAGEKHVGIYPRHAVLPNVDYFAEPLSYAGRSLSEREAWRTGWLGRALSAADAASLVVLDPDNGLMPERVSPSTKQAIKYAALDECAAFYGGGARTLVVYQHAHRRGTLAEQAGRGLDRLAQHLELPRGDVFALRFHRGTSRCYLVIPAPGQARVMRKHAAEMVAGVWGQRGHFSLIP